MAQNYKIGDSRVLESRESADGITIRRRRETSDGKHRFTTYERIERPSLIVIKRDGARAVFDREKLLNSTQRSVGKFFNSDMEIEEIINAVEDKLYGLGESEVQSRRIGEIVLDELGNRNEVAYVRFASVFHKFETLDDFVHILEQRKGEQ
ncbi:MAG: transcriptional regulator NrdR [Candidatus Saccharimonas sp.]